METSKLLNDLPEQILNMILSYLNINEKSKYRYVCLRWYKAITKIINFNELPDSLLLKIFNNLDIKDKFKTRRVCQLWNQLLSEVLIKQTTIGIEWNWSEDPLIRDCVSEYQKKDVYLDRWMCSSRRHHPFQCDILDKKVFKKIGNNEIPLHYIFSMCAKIESIDLRTVEISYELINIINTYCINLKCVHLDSIRIKNLEVWKILTTIMRKVEHLSINNVITIESDNFEDFTFHQFFRNAEVLEEIALNIYDSPIQSIFNFESLRDLGTNVNLATIKVNVSNHNITDPILSHLQNGGARGLKFLTLKTISESGEHLMYIIRKIGGFRNLVALCFCHKYNITLVEDYKRIAQLEHLRSLSIDFMGDVRIDDYYEDDVRQPNYLTDFTLEGEEQILEVLCKSQFRSKLESLKLFDGTISSISFKNISQSYKNLKHLELYDITLINLKESLQSISKMTKLTELRIEYKFRSKKNFNFEFSEEEYEFYKVQHSFHNKCVQYIKQIIKNCKQLQKLSIIEWPGFQSQEYESCKRFAEEHNNVKFVFKPFPEKGLSN